MGPELLFHAVAIISSAALISAASYWGTHTVQAGCQRYATALALGIHLYAPCKVLRYGRRGNSVSAVRRMTGLGPLAR